MDKDPIFILLFGGTGFFRSTPDYRQKLHRKWASRARRRAAVRRSFVKQWKTKSKDEMTEATTATTTSAATTSTTRPPAFAIRPIPGVKGNGSFAIRDIKQGEVLFEEDAALFITISEVQAAVVEHGLAREEHEEPVTPGNKSPVEVEFSSSQPPQDLHGAALIANEGSCSRRPQSTPASSSSTERQQDAGLLQKIRVDPRRLVVERKFGELWNRDRLPEPVAVPPPPSMRLPPPINLCCPASEAACFGGTTTTYEDVDGSKGIAYKNSGCSRSSERILRMYDRTEQVASSSAARNRSPYGIFLTNAYDVPGMRGTGLYPLVGKGFNHSCRPNVGYDFVENTWRMRLFAARDIDKGDELCTCYCSLSVLLKGSAERQKFFAENNAFECGCEVCACREDGEDGDVVSRRVAVEKSDANRAEIAECLAAISGYEDIRSSSMRGVREAGRRKGRRKDAAVALTFIEEARKLLVEEKLLRQDLWIEYAELAFEAATVCGDDKRRENYCEEVLNLLEVTGRKWTTAAGGGGLIESKKWQEYSQFRAEIKREQEEPSVASPASKSRPLTVV